MCELYLELVSVTFECRTKHRAIIRKAETAVECHTVFTSSRRTVGCKWSQSHPAENGHRNLSLCSLAKKQSQQ